MESYMEEYGRNGEGDDERQPHSLGSEIEIERERESQRQGDADIREERDAHRYAHVLYTTQHCCTDTLESVGILKQTTDE